MKTLKDILKSVEAKSIKGSIDIAIEGIQFDSRKVVKNTVFVAVPGTQNDGHQYIEKAIELGATAIICQTLPKSLNTNITYIEVADSAWVLGIAIANFYDNPSSKLKLVGVTGTNGKTTTATMLYWLYKAMGYKVGLISTVIYYVNDEAFESTHTTPDPLMLHSLMAKMADAGCQYCFMEVSSHSIAQKRIAGLHFDGAIFTNLTHDHLDYHLTFDNYLKAKKELFDSLPKEAFAIVNIDDKNGRVMVQNTKAEVKTYALQSVADFQAKIIESHFDGMQLIFDGKDFWTPLTGKFNAYNLLAIYSTAVMLGSNKEEVMTKLSTFGHVRGRFETIRAKNGMTAIIDYAHTPDALENVLNAIRQIRQSHQKIITVVGAGGNRDKTKRPVMAKVCVTLSDKVIITSDNPRFEEPEDIIADMMQGIDAKDKLKTLKITDRREAIKTAVMLATPDDIILIAGKGHETYQEIKGVKHHFDDKEEIAQLLMTNDK
ncbi:MAG TPA: UDP-N-acetylmuramoyl-L-alanyl-D-glutamate--2,6-diaminopimelate ligase [Bacteroidales bacterium]|nr:UDP-N-acetylmuramoyl-L-alanyl-D-glutamate--2,6-diaminopimelate ligase [Bacteroidales bacterium]